MKNFGSGPTWLSGTIIEVRGPLSYTVTLADSRVVWKHIDQIRTRTVVSDDFLPATMTESTPSPVSSTSDSSTVVVPPLRCYTRVRHPPDRYLPENFI